MSCARPNHICPLCGGPNACAPAVSGSLDTPCWCRQATFSQALLERVPAEQRGLACICARCAGFHVDSLSVEGQPTSATES